MALTTAVLDLQTCKDCGTDNHVHELYFHSACHTGSPTWAIYSKDTGILRIICSICEKPIAEVEVALGIGAV